MKFVLVLAAVACASADVSHILKDEANAAVISSSLNVLPDGSFQYGYETSNGIASQANGYIENPNSEYPSQAVSGSYKYISDNGQPIEVTYVADSEGFKPSGSHLPVAPPIPEAIARSIEYNAARAAQAERIPVPGAALLG